MSYKYLCNKGIERLWRYFEDWAAEYARINGLDKQAVIEAIASRHRYLSTQQNRRGCGAQKEVRW